MKKKFEYPILTIDVFDFESIITSSGTSDAMNSALSDVENGKVQSGSGKTITDVVQFTL